MFEWEKLFTEALIQFNSSFLIKSSEISEKIDFYASNFPTSMDDIQGALNGLYRLQDSYNLNITQFASGTVSIEKLSPVKFQSYTGLIYEDLKLIARIAFERKNYFRSVEWFNEALKYALVTKNQNFVKE